MRKFSFTETINGKPKKYPCTVKHADKSRDIYLTESHLKAAIRNHGAGTTDHCVMAQACQGNRRELGLPDGPVWVAWYYSRCYVGSKLNAAGKPTECVVYEHTDSVGKKFDTLQGQKDMLLELVLNGPRLVHLAPLPASRRGRHGVNKGVPTTTAERKEKLGWKADKKHTIQRPRRGAALRRQVAEAEGLVPVAKPSKKKAAAIA